jgi:hypothetical protein
MSFPLAEFAILYAAALFGAVAIVPFSLRMLKSSPAAAKVSPTVAALAGLAQNAVLFAVVVAVGLVASRAVGVCGTYVAAWVGDAPPSRSFVQAMGLAAGTGAAAGLFLTGADLMMLPRLPAMLELARRSTLWENFSASFYGGINEELLMRLFGVSGLVWLMSRVWRAQPMPPAIYWTAIVAMAVLFALGHLPASRAVAGRIGGLILVRALALNLPIAILCGWLFWRYGIEAAIVAHFTADIVYHVGGTALLQANDRRRFMRWFPPPNTN